VVHGWQIASTMGLYATMKSTDSREPGTGLHPTEDRSPDADDRIEEFLARHGGPGAPLQETFGAGGVSGRWEIRAGDGYTLLCNWSRTGSRQEMEFSEVPPASTSGEIT